MDTSLLTPLECSPWFLPSPPPQLSLSGPLPMTPEEARRAKSPKEASRQTMTPEQASLTPKQAPMQGMIPESGDSCYCADALTDIIQCSDKEKTTYITIGFCMSYDEEMEMVLVGLCPYFIVTPDIEGFWIPLPRNVSLIGKKLCESINREGLLCGRCIEGYGISIYSNNLACVDCEENPYGWVWFFFSEILLQTLFFLIVFFLRISVNTEKFNGFVLFCQILISTRIDLILPDYLVNTGHVKLRNLVIFLCVFYRFWVLDFFTWLIPQACFHRDLDMLGAVALGYVSAFYPFVLILLTFLLVRLRDCNFKPVTVVWKPYQRLKRMAHKYIDLRQSLLHTFSSFIVLSYSKLALVSFSLLFPTDIYNASGVKVFQNRWYHDAEIQLFDQQHVPYGILALVVFMTFVIAPPLVLILYPFKWFRWVLHKVRLDRPALNAFIDSFQGCYKDGTNNSKDRRCFSALYFVLRLLFFATRLIANDRWQLNIVNFIFVAATILFAYFQPYKTGIYNLVDICFLSLLAFQFYAYSVFTTHGAFTRSFPDAALFTLAIIGFIPLVYFTTILLYHLLQSVKATEKWRRWIVRYQSQQQDVLTESWPYRLMDEETTFQSSVQQDQGDHSL